MSSLRNSISKSKIFPFFLLYLILLSGNILSDSKKSSSSQFRYIGEIKENSIHSFYPSRYLIKEEGMVYEGFSHRAGGVNLLFPNNPPKETDKLILLIGELKRDLTKQIKIIKKMKESEFASMEHQSIEIKSQWLPPENFANNKSLISTLPGVTTRERLSSLVYFEIDQFKYIDVIGYSEQANQKIKVTFTNPTDLDFPDLNLLVKYEGRKGKPAPKFNHINIPNLKKGESRDIVLDKIYTVQYTKVTGEDFHIHSLEITGQNSSSLININFPIKEKLEFNK